MGFLNDLVNDAFDAAESTGKRLEDWFAKAIDEEE